MSSALQCPVCKVVKDAVIDSRPSTRDGEIVIRRRRKCKSCGFRWSTIEMKVDVLEKIETGLRDIETIRKAFNG